MSAPAGLPDDQRFRQALLVNELTRPLVDAREYRSAMGQFATGVTVVTCLAADGSPVGMTANSFTSVSLDPPLVLWSLDRGARGYAAFAAAERFAFTVLSRDQTGVSHRFARAGADKFAGLDWRPGLGGVPLLPGGSAHIECVTEAMHDGGDHRIVVGRAVRVARFERPPLVFAGGAYGVIAPHPETEDAVGPADRSGRDPDDGLLLPLLFRATNTLAASEADALDGRSLTGPPMRLLAVLAARGPTTTDALADAAMTSDQTFDDALASLEAAGRIERTADYIAITRAGADDVTRYLSLADAHERAGPLTDADLETLRALLHRLASRPGG